MRTESDGSGSITVRAKTPENLYFEEFIKTVEGISASTNIDWYTPAFQPRNTEAAVEILSLMR